MCILAERVMIVLCHSEWRSHANSLSNFEARNKALGLSIKTKRFESLSQGAGETKLIRYIFSLLRRKKKLKSIELEEAELKYNPSN